MYDFCKQGQMIQLSSCGGAAGVVLAPLLLDPDERTLMGVEMEPLLAGELALLTYLGARPRVWHSSRRLAESVYHRDDPAGRELVWKYVSTLRRKIKGARPGLIEVCRRRGYRCNELVELASRSRDVA